jgi:hypothetical protein|nr:MAG TPA: hypothetical protein [Caudoviricetes sp.]
MLPYDQLQEDALIQDICLGIIIVSVIFLVIAVIHLCSKE